MDYGFRVPIRGALTAPEPLSTLTRHAEALGFAFISSPDHVVMPAATGSEYPYGGTPAFQVKTNEGEFLEALTVLSFLAGQTHRARLLTSVMVVPYRQPVLAAKMLSTLDYLSNGRVVVGCGVGWLREEFEALGAPPYDARGAAVDEYLQVFKELWTSRRPSFEGRFVRFPPLVFEPRPIQKPHPPLWIGGESLTALRRVVRLGDGWYPSGGSGAVDTPEGFAARVTILRGLLEEAERDPASVTIGLGTGHFNQGRVEIGADGSRFSLTGSTEQVAEDIRAYEAAGLRHLLIRFPGETQSELANNMERFMKEVAPLVGR